MADPVLLQQRTVRVADVVVGRRLRPVSAAAVESLAASVAETGVLQAAIHIRKKKDGSLHLIAGAHRLAMAVKLGWSDIEAKVWTDVTDDWARLMEIDDNLAGAEMNALDTAVFLATRKAIYEKLHPETKWGVAGGLARQKSATDIMSVASFAATTAEKFGLTDRHVRRLIAAGSALHPDQVAALRGAPGPVTLADLQALAKADAVQRGVAVEAFAAGRVRKLAQALKPAVSAPVKAPVEGTFKALRDAWTRASKADRKKFLGVEGKVIFDLLRELREGKE